MHKYALHIYFIDAVYIYLYIFTHTHINTYKCHDLPPLTLCESVSSFSSEDVD